MSDDTSFTGSRLVVLPRDFFDPDREFFDHIDINTVRNDPPLDVDSWETGLFDRFAKRLDPVAVELEDGEQDENPDLDVDGFESSLFARAKKYFDPRNK